MKKMKRGKNVVMAAPSAPYGSNIPFMKSLFGINFTARIDTDTDTIVLRFLPLFPPPNIALFLRAVYVTMNIIMKSISFAIRNSSKLSTSNIKLERNWIIKSIISPRPFRSCSTPSTGPAETRDERKIVRNAGMLFFILDLDDLGLYNLVWQCL